MSSREERATPLRHGSRAAGVVLMLSASLLWSTGGLGIKSLSMTPMSVAGWRGLFALPVFSAHLVSRLRAAGSVSASSIRSPWVWVGALAYAIMMIAFV